MRQQINHGLTIQGVAFQPAECADCRDKMRYWLQKLWNGDSGKTLTLGATLDLQDSSKSIEQQAGLGLSQ